MEVDDIIASPIALIASPLERNTCSIVPLSTSPSMFRYIQIRFTETQPVLDSDWTAVIKQHLRARPTGFLYASAERTISEYSRENTALKVRTFCLVVV